MKHQKNSYKKTDCVSFIFRDKRLLLFGLAVLVIMSFVMLDMQSTEAQLTAPLVPGRDVPIIIRNYTPPAWQAQDIGWVRDQSPHNKIDDLIDNSTSTAGVFDVVINFKHCIDAEILVNLENLGEKSKVDRKLQYITSVLMNDVSRNELAIIADWDSVAFIEGQWGFVPTLNVSLPSSCITAGSANCAGNVEALGFNGSGVNIAIVDSGVDNDIHHTFATTTFVAGYDAVTSTFGDPDDDYGHGTHVASIALGQGGTSTPRGVAPGAGLIDVRVVDAASVSCATPGLWAQVTDGLETLYNNHVAWGVDVINMSLGQCNAAGFVASDGLDAFSQLVDLAESMGIVVVAAVGNSGPANTFLTTPAAATRSITVAAYNDHNTGTWADDTVCFFSSRGPRDDDGDADDRDELKPEVIAPGQGILAADYNTIDGTIAKDGTSMAAPHVAGVAALIIDALPNINPASVKHLILSSADPRGAAASLPLIDPVWNNRSGFGYLNAFAALSAAINTDLTFPHHPANPSWLSPDISVTPYPPQVGHNATVTAVIENRGPVPANDAHIHFGTHVFSAATPTFQDIATQIMNLPLGITTVTAPWIPANASHQCMKVEIGYGGDTDYSNNTAQRNITVTMSPATFWVQNMVSEEPREITFISTLEDPDKKWGVKIIPDSVTLAAEDCPKEIKVIMEAPGGTPLGETQTVHIAAVTTDPESGKKIEIGGISVTDTVKEERKYPWIIWIIIIIVIIIIIGVVIKLKPKEPGATGMTGGGVLNR